MNILKTNLTILDYIVLFYILHIYRMYVIAITCCTAVYFTVFCHKTTHLKSIK